MGRFENAFPHSCLMTSPWHEASTIFRHVLLYLIIPTNTNTIVLYTYSAAGNRKNVTKEEKSWHKTCHTTNERIAIAPSSTKRDSNANSGKWDQNLCLHMYLDDGHIGECAGHLWNSIGIQEGEYFRNRIIKTRHNNTFTAAILIGHVNRPALCKVATWNDLVRPGPPL